MAQVIDRVFGLPDSDGDQSTLIVGQSHWLTKQTIDKIERVEENLGTYSIVWFKDYTLTGHELARMNAIAVAEVIYRGEG